MSYPCELVQQAAQPALTIRTHAAVQDLPQLFGRAYGAIMQYMGEAGTQPAGMPFTAYYDLNMQNLDVEVGFPVSVQVAGKGEIQPSEFPGGTLATVWHIGPYDQIGAAYDALNAWIKEKGYQPAGPVYEIYYSEPETPPEQIRTQVVFPVKPV